MTNAYQKMVDSSDDLFGTGKPHKPKLVIALDEARLLSVTCLTVIARQLSSVGGSTDTLERTENDNHWVVFVSMVSGGGPCCFSAALPCAMTLREYPGTGGWSIHPLFKDQSNQPRMGNSGNSSMGLPNEFCDLFRFIFGGNFREEAGETTNGLARELRMDISEPRRMVTTSWREPYRYSLVAKAHGTHHAN
ncbi:hypothetical protein EDD17DRAFT_1509562 [Pisolithus thermaeus]|nr:hypothetical protein EV401DRAFT_1891951 [Pisolithus croceorrhizus]KAI6161103.1 hypothetical protein EDD17DRAFT_1509562 [Pisolithus thermaeus]